MFGCPKTLLRRYAAGLSHFYMQLEDDVQADFLGSKNPRGESADFVPSVKRDAQKPWFRDLSR